MLRKFPSALARKKMTFHSDTRINHLGDYPKVLQDEVKLVVDQFRDDKDLYLEFLTVESSLAPGFGSKLATQINRPKALRKTDFTAFEFHGMVQDFFHRDCFTGFVIPNVRTSSGITTIRQTALRQFRPDMLPILLDIFYKLEDNGFPLETIFCEITHVAFIQAYQATGGNVDDILVGSIREECDSTTGIMNQLIVLKNSFEVFSFFEGRFEPIGRISVLIENPTIQLSPTNFPIDYSWNPSFNPSIDFDAETCINRAIKRFMIQKTTVGHGVIDLINIDSDTKIEDISICTDFSLGFSDLTEITFSPKGLSPPQTAPEEPSDLQQVFPRRVLQYSLLNTDTMYEQMSLDHTLLEAVAIIPSLQKALLDAYKKCYADFGEWIISVKRRESSYRDALSFLSAMSEWFDNSMILEALPTVPEVDCKIIWCYMMQALEMAKEANLQSVKLATLKKVAANLPLQIEALSEVRNLIADEMKQMTTVQHVVIDDAEVCGGGTIDQHRLSLERRMNSELYDKIDDGFATFFLLKEQIMMGMRENLA